MTIFTPYKHEILPPYRDNTGITYCSIDRQIVIGNYVVPIGQYPTSLLLNGFVLYDMNNNKLFAEWDHAHMFFMGFRKRREDLYDTPAGNRVEGYMVVNELSIPNWLSIDGGIKLYGTIEEEYIRNERAS